MQHKSELNPPPLPLPHATLRNTPWAEVCPHSLADLAASRAEGEGVSDAPMFPHFTWT